MKILTFCVSFFLLLKTARMETSTEDDLIVIKADKKVIGEEIIQSWLALEATVSEECKKKTGYDEYYLDDILNNKLTVKNELKCYGKCIYELLDFLDNENNFNTELMGDKIAGLSQEEAKKCVTSNSTRKDMCNKINAIIMCVVDSVIRSRST